MDRGHAGQRSEGDRHGQVWPIGPGEELLHHGEGRRTERVELSAEEVVEERRARGRDRRRGWNRDAREEVIERRARHSATKAERGRDRWQGGRKRDRRREAVDELE